MTLELNLWFSDKNASIFGNITNKQTFEKHKFNKLLSAEDFINNSISQQLMDMEIAQAFMERAEFDDDAMYAWTSDKKYIAWWNKDKQVAFIFYSGRILEMRIGERRTSNVKGAPDVWFRK